MPESIDIQVPENVTMERVGFAIDKIVLDLQLTVTMRGTLKTFPGSTHWHAKRGRGRGRGRLEVTWWPQRRKLWITIQAGRRAPWIEEIVPGDRIGD
jgi:hypothetical protein